MNSSLSMPNRSLEIGVDLGHMSVARGPSLPHEAARSEDRIRLQLKRAIDVIGSVTGLVLLGLPMLVIAALVRLDSPGASLFWQLRRGRGGRPFWFAKFRTMTADAESRVGELEALNETSGGVLFKIRRDPRVTRLGRLFRRTSLDELPQLFNVLRGDMSLVGPRPLQLTASGSSRPTPSATSGV